MLEGQTIQQLRAAIHSGKLSEPFNAARANALLKIDWAGTFLAKHCEGNGHTTELFTRVTRGLYRLKRK